MEAQDYMKRGELVPDEVMVGIVQEWLGEPNEHKGFIMDGFPRTVPQAEKLSDALGNHGVDQVLFLDVPRQILIERLVARRVCASCGAEYNLVFKKPARAGICDLCGGELVQRSDDLEATVRRRLEVYRESTAPLLEYYRKRGVLVNVNGQGDREDVFGRLLKALES
jgi:adenylate kinase